MPNFSAPASLVELQTLITATPPGLPDAIAPAAAEAMAAVAAGLSPANSALYVAKMGALLPQFRATELKKLVSAILADRAMAAAAVSKAEKLAAKMMAKAAAVEAKLAERQAREQAKADAARREQAALAAAAIAEGAAKAAKDAAKAGRCELGAREVIVGGIRGLKSDDWCGQVAGFIGDLTYINSNREICTQVPHGALEPISARTLPTWLDKGTRCALVRIGKTGEVEECGLALPSYAALFGGWVAGDDGQACKYLRYVDVVSKIPLLVKDGPTSVRLVKGYDAQSRTLAAGGEIDLTLSVKECKRRLDDLLGEFAYITMGDKSRAFAMLLTKALLAAGMITGRAAFFLCSKALAGAGASTMMDMFCALYAEDGFINGVGPKFLEELTSVLAQGSGLINIDNLNGDKLCDDEISGKLSSCVTAEIFRGREVYGKPMTLDMSRRFFVGSTLGVEMSKEMASRTMVIGIKSQPKDKRFKFHGDNALRNHVRANREYYLSAVYSLTARWYDEGKGAKSGDEGFRFSDWSATVGGLMKFAYPELPHPAAGIRETQDNLANKSFAKLRDIFIHCATEFVGRDDVTALNIVASLYAKATGNELPGDWDEMLAALKEAGVPSPADIGRDMARFFDCKPTDGQQDDKIFEGYVIGRHHKVVDTKRPEGKSFYRFATAA
jgi:hypothetical protein